MSSCSLLESLLVLRRERLESPSPADVVFSQKNEIGYFINIKTVIIADRSSQRQVCFMFATILTGIFVGSFVLGVPYFAVNIVVFLLTAFGTISPSAKENAVQHVLSLATILHKWRREDAGGCDEWVKHASSLRPLYETVKKTFPKPHPRRIVMVDDESYVLEMTGLVVRHRYQNATLRTFEDGEQAWQELLRADPDLLTTDWNRSKPDGRELLRRLADRKVSYPIIVISGLAQAEDMREFSDRGLNVTLLSKPYTKEQLWSELSRFFGPGDNEGCMA